jgi:putative FmdB family regulatory protein
MPIYEYECSSCAGIEEVIQRFSDPPLKRCKACNGEMHKLVSHSSFHLKGSGWYVTDYAKKSGAPAACSKTAKQEDKAVSKADKTTDAGTTVSAKGSAASSD